MLINTIFSGATAEVIIDGRFNFGCHQLFQKTCNNIIKSQVNSIIINLNNVNYMDSSALGMLLQLQDKAEQTAILVTLKSTCPSISNVLRIAHFEKVFQIDWV